MTGSMRSLVGNVGRQLSGAIPLRVLQRLAPRDVIAVCYHVVSDQQLPHIRHLYAYKSVDAFRQDLLFLRSEYRVIGYQELHDHRLAGKPLAPCSVHLSFDDGFAECDSVVRPVLVELGLPCTFFINTDFVDNRALFYRNQVSLCIDRLESLSPEERAAAVRQAAAQFGRELVSADDLLRWIGGLNHEDRAILDDLCQLLGVDCQAFLATRKPYLTHEQIRQMAAAGFTFGGHTRNHQRLTRLNSLDELNRQIVQSCQDVRDFTGQAIVPFAFPFMGAGIDRAALAQIRRDHEFVGLLFDTQKLRKDSDFMVNRICCDSPPASPAGKSNLPTALRNAYLSLTTGLLRT